MGRVRACAFALVARAAHGGVCNISPRGYYVFCINAHDAQRAMLHFKPKALHTGYVQRIWALFVLFAQRCGLAVGGFTRACIME